MMANNFVLILWFLCGLQTILCITVSPDVTARNVSHNESKDEEVATVTQKSERFRRLIPYMTFYVPPNFPVDEFYNLNPINIPYQLYQQPVETPAKRVVNPFTSKNKLPGSFTPIVYADNDQAVLKVQALRGEEQEKILQEPVVADGSVSTTPRPAYYAISPSNAPLQHNLEGLTPQQQYVVYLQQQMQYQNQGHRLQQPSYLDPVSSTQLPPVEGLSTTPNPVIYTHSTQPSPSLASDEEAYNQIPEQPVQEVKLQRQHAISQMSTEEKLNFLDFLRQRQAQILADANSFTANQLLNPFAAPIPYYPSSSPSYAPPSELEPHYEPDPIYKVPVKKTPIPFRQHLTETTNLGPAYHPQNRPVTTPSPKYNSFNTPSRTEKRKQALRQRTTIPPPIVSSEPPRLHFTEQDVILQPEIFPTGQPKIRPDAVYSSQQEEEKEILIPRPKPRPTIPTLYQLPEQQRPSESIRLPETEYRPSALQPYREQIILSHPPETRPDVILKQRPQLRPELKFKPHHVYRPVASPSSIPQAEIKPELPPNHHQEYVEIVYRPEIMQRPESEHRPSLHLRPEHDQPEQRPVLHRRPQYKPSEPPRLTFNRRPEPELNLLEQHSSSSPSLHAENRPEIVQSHPSGPEHFNTDLIQKSDSRAPSSHYSPTLPTPTDYAHTAVEAQHTDPEASADLVPRPEIKPAYRPRPVIAKSKPHSHSDSEPESSHPISTPSPPADHDESHHPSEELSDESRNSLAEILKKLQDSNHLPKTLTPDNIDNSIKTLIKILNNLKETQTIVADPPQYHEEENYQQENEDISTHQIANKKQPGPGTGRPGVDYPILDEIPKTSFNCKEQRYKGFFGDPETNCQVWHYCDLNGGQASFLCPNGTIFSQVALTCDWWFNVKCSTTPQLYVLNERLYKYILPFTPKFPEDYSGPLVDKYLALKFQEMEEKMRRERLKNKESEESEGSKESKSEMDDKKEEASEEDDELGGNSSIDTGLLSYSTAEPSTTTEITSNSIAPLVSSTVESYTGKPIASTTTTYAAVSSDESEHSDESSSSSETNKSKTTVESEKVEVIEIKTNGDSGHLNPGARTTYVTQN